MVGGPEYAFDYDPKKKILYKKHLGNVTLKEIFGSWDRAIQDNLIPEDTTGFILDFSKAHIGIDLSSTKVITRYFDDRAEIFGGKKMAVIVTSPTEIILPILIEHMTKSYQLKPFATEMAAINWILG